MLQWQTITPTMLQCHFILMQNVTTDIKFLAYEHALAISAAAQVLCLQVSLRSWAK